MKRLNTQTGSHVLGIALVVLALAFIGFAGYVVSTHHSKKPVAATTATKTPAAKSTIDNKADLSAAASSLDTSSSSLNSSVNGDNLNSDLNDLL